jgi:hypothetical protein
MNNIPDGRSVWRLALTWDNIKMDIREIGVETLTCSFL